MVPMMIRETLPNVIRHAITKRLLPTALGLPPGSVILDVKQMPGGVGIVVGTPKDGPQPDFSKLPEGTTFLGQTDDPAESKKILGQHLQKGGHLFDFVDQVTGRKRSLH